MANLTDTLLAYRISKRGEGGLRRMASRTVNYPVFDVDNHYYESTDAFTKYLPRDYKNVIKYVEVDGRTKMAVKGRITNFIPNPTFNVVSPPGAYETLYMLKNP